jgi:hypothetical protein
MKKIYMIIALAMATVGANAQSTTACKTATGGIEITFDDTKSCSGVMAGNTKVGFHSGVNVWKNVVNWDAATAINGIAVAGSSNKKFKITIKDPKAYYGTTDPITEIDFVINQGPKDPAKAWDAKGEDKKADGTCSDIFLLGVDKLAACVLTAADLKLDVKATLAPNPMEATTLLSINNTTNEIFTVDVTSVTGQVVRTITNVTDTAVIEKGNMTAGLYFVVIRNAAGKFSTQKLIVE